MQRHMIYLLALVLLASCTPSLDSGEPVIYPEFLEAVQPRPGETAQLSNPSFWPMGFSDPGDICVKILMETLLRPGDDLVFWENARIIVDKRLVAGEPTHLNEEEAVTLFDENNIVATQIYEDGNFSVEYEVVARGAYSDTLCWSDILTSGTHTVELEVWTSTSESFSFTWRFRITS